MVTIDEAGAMLDEIAQELPADFYSQLNGGIMLLPNAKTHEAAGNSDDLYIMGEYTSSHTLGRFITIYFGSFEIVYGYMPPKAFREQLKRVLVHEFTHHLENLAGDRSLERKDELNLEKYKQRKKQTMKDIFPASGGENTLAAGAAHLEKGAAKVIPRQRHVGRKILLCLLVLIISTAAIIASIKRDTLRFFFDPSLITANDPAHIADAVRRGNYLDLAIDGDPAGDMSIDFYIPDRSVRISARFVNGNAAVLSGEIYPSLLTISTADQGFALAEELLLPYFSKPEIEALELGLAGAIIQNAMAQYIDFSVSMGDYTISASGMPVGGTVEFWLNFP